LCKEEQLLQLSVGARSWVVQEHCRRDCDQRREETPRVTSLIRLDFGEFFELCS
jgi:hypothetical protein